MTEESVLYDLRDLKSKDTDLKWTAINNLRKYLQTNPPTDFRSRMIIKSLLGLTKDPEARIREITLLTLIEAIPDSSDMEPLIIRSLSDPSPGIRSIALEWLHNCKHPKLKNYAIRALHDNGEIVRKTALDIVIANQIEGVETDLIQLLKTEKGGLRRSVIYTLGKLKTAQAINTLIDIMRNPEYDDWTRNQASSALDHMGGKEIIIPFIENLADSNNYVRETAASFLKKNEKDVISVILASGRLDFLGLIQYATEKTRQNFDSLIDVLKGQMELAIKNLKSSLELKDQIIYSELASELKCTEIAMRSLIEKILNISLIPITNGKFLTETGLRNAFSKKLNEKGSIYLPSLQKEPLFGKISDEIILKIINSIEFSHKLDDHLFITKEIHSSVLEELRSTGLLNLTKIADKIHQPLKIVKESLIPTLDSIDEGWINSRNEYITLTYIKQLISLNIDELGVISLDKFLKQMGNPKIDPQRIRKVIGELYKGKWLTKINIFLNMAKFKELEQNASRIDESSVKDILDVIEIDFETFLHNLQEIVDIPTFKTKKGYLIPLESLHSALQQKILSKRYLDIEKFLKEMKFESITDKKKQSVLDYINQEFSGRSDPEGRIFVLEDLITDIIKECETKHRINFSVLGFKLNMDPEILSFIIKRVLFIRGFTNKMGEFVTQIGISEEIAGIMKFRQEFSFQELFEILEITDNKKHMEMVRELVTEDKNLLISQDNKIVMSPKKAINKIATFIKNPNQQLTKKISIEQISLETNISPSKVKKILDSLIKNNLITGSLKGDEYKP